MSMLNVDLRIHGDGPVRRIDVRDASPRLVAELLRAKAREVEVEYGLRVDPAEKE